MANSKKLTVINTKPPTKDGGLFSYWGNQGNTAMQQGWYPAVQGSDFTVYRSGYNAPFNDVFNPKNPTQKGRLSVIGKKGNKMDIVIEGGDGNIIHKVHENVSPDFVQNYMTNNQSIVQQRMNNISSKRLAAVTINKKGSF